MMPSKASVFRELHRGKAAEGFVLPNAWDPMSARLMEQSGARAIGTTSGGISWSLGYQDGQNVSRKKMLGIVAQIVAAVRVPVTADIESGYGDGSPTAVADTVRMTIDTGAVGVNIEDSASSYVRRLSAPHPKA